MDALERAIFLKDAASVKQILVSYKPSDYEFRQILRWSSTYHAFVLCDLIEAAPKTRDFKNMVCFGGLPREMTMETRQCFENAGYPVDDDVRLVTESSVGNTIAVARLLWKKQNPQVMEDAFKRATSKCHIDVMAQLLRSVEVRYRRRLLFLAGYHFFEVKTLRFLIDNGAKMSGQYIRHAAMLVQKEPRMFELVLSKIEEISIEPSILISRNEIALSMMLDATPQPTVNNYHVNYIIGCALWQHHGDVDFKMAKMLLDTALRQYSTIYFTRVDRKRIKNSGAEWAALLKDFKSAQNRRLEMQKILHEDTYGPRSPSFYEAEGNFDRVRGKLPTCNLWSSCISTRSVLVFQI